MPELGPDPIYPPNVSDATYMADLNQRVMDMLVEKVKTQAQELVTWKCAYERLFATNEQHIEQMAGLQEWLDARGASLQEEFALTRKLEDRVKELEKLLLDARIAQIDGGGELQD